ncbi:poly-gamma-glutamate hydrolase family protein [Sphingomonas sp. ZT3P38]|uniref:poly-gamma-glutamate hydrolase family protein n=1 Tax=Parasphingomonas zepuensis TaxID=3096161 RepID=UPI002FCA6386
MTDRYRTFKDLAANEQLEIDYRIRVRDRGSLSVIIAPHGGWIEPGTSEIAEAIAGTDLSFYAFEALKVGAHGDLHITSHRFDEPTALDLVSRSRAAVAIHGRRNDGSEAVWLGGRAIDLRDVIGACLRSAGFEAETNRRLPGLERTNVCNRTISGEGVQLELPRSLRHQLTSRTDLLRDFREAVRNAIVASPPT